MIYKKVFILICLISPLLLQAQIEKGRFFLSGNIEGQFNRSKSLFTTVVFVDNDLEQVALEAETTINRFNFSPQIGYIFSKHLAGGIQFSYLYALQKNDFSENVNIQLISSQQQQQQFVIGPFLRYYTPLTDKAGFLFDLSLGYGLGKETQEEDNTEVTSADITTFQASVNPTFYYFVTPSLALEASIGGLNYSDIDREVNEIQNNNSFQNLNSPNESTNFNVSFGSTFRIGLNYYFGGQEKSE